jgi:hypothetical protein
MLPSTAAASPVAGAAVDAGEAPPSGSDPGLTEENAATSEPERPEAAGPGDGGCDD